MSAPEKRRTAVHTSAHWSCCIPFAFGRDTDSQHYTRSNGTPHADLLPRESNPLLSIQQRFRQNRPTEPSATSIHRCLLISEILALILDFVRRFDESAESDRKSDRTWGRRTLASLARTCRTLSGPTLDTLWMRLDSLDPLIQVLPRRMWAKKHYSFVVRMFMGDKQWATFHKYARRVKFLRGPCRNMSVMIQNNVIAAIAQYPKASSPLLPDLTELMWSEPRMPCLVDHSLSLKHFAGPRMTTISLFLLCPPSEFAIPSNLPTLCPNITSFTVSFPRSSYNDHSHEIGDIVQQWPRLRVLRSCALSQPVMDILISRGTLNTLSVELNNSNTAFYVGCLPSHVHTLSLGGNSAAICLRYLETIQGSPTDFHLRVGADDSTTGDMETLVMGLPVRLDKTRLRSLTVELTSSYWSAPASDSFFLSLPLLSSLSSFSSLRELDVSTFCSAEVDDEMYESWIAGMNRLKSLKVGVEDVTRAKPAASVGAVLAILKACPELETLRIVFDGSLTPPPRRIGPDDRGKRHCGSGTRAETKDGTEWGVTNHHITHLHVGHSPIGEDEKEMEALAHCLKTVMPLLEKIRVEKYISDVDVRWRRVQDMLVRKEGHV